MLYKSSQEVEKLKKNFFWSKQWKFYVKQEFEGWKSPYFQKFKLYQAAKK